MQKIVQNKKKIEFGTKMTYLGVLGYKFEILSYLKTASSNLSKCKVSCKIKNPYFWYIKVPDLGVFRLQF